MTGRLLRFLAPYVVLLLAIAIAVEAYLSLTLPGRAG